LIIFLKEKKITEGIQVEHNAAKQQWWFSPVLVGSLIQRRIFSGYQSGYIGIYQAVFIL